MRTSFGCYGNRLVCKTVNPLTATLIIRRSMCADANAYTVAPHESHTHFTCSTYILFGCAHAFLYQFTFEEACLFVLIFEWYKMKGFKLHVWWFSPPDISCINFSLLQDIDLVEHTQTRNRESKEREKLTHRFWSLCYSIPLIVWLMWPWVRCQRSLLEIGWHTGWWRPHTWCHTDSTTLRCLLWWWG